MKRCVKWLSILTALLMLVSVMPLSVSAAALKITTQPKTSYTSYGSTAKATVKAKGDGLKYTWYVKNAGASKYTKSSVTKSTYTAKMTDSVKGRSVYCVVKDKKGKTVKSSTAILRMKATITTEPKTTYAKQGATAKVTVKAKGDGLKYTWYFKNAGKTKYTKSSVTKSTYSVKMSDSVNGRYVYCVVTDKYGKTDKSKTVVLRQAVTITTQPKSAKVKLGATAKVTVKAVGDGLKYAWYVKNAGASKYTKSSVTKSTYSVKMSDSVNGRLVYCIVTDKYGKSEQSKTVKLTCTNSPLTITKQPESTSAAKGDFVGFGIVVKGGTEPYTYELQYSVKGHNQWSNGIMAGVEILKMGDMVELAFPVSFSNDYLYRIVVTDAAGNKVTSNTVTVEQMASSDLEIVVQPQPVQGAVGDDVTFFVEVAGGTEPYTYCWQYIFDGRDYWDDFIVDGYDTDTISLVVESVDFTSHFRYRCVITDAEGAEIVSDEVWVKSAAGLPTITKQPESTTAAAGDTVGFGIEVSGGTAPYSYQLKYTHSLLVGWYDMDAEILTVGPMTELTFVVTEQSLAKQYLYCIVVTDAAGGEVYSNVVFVTQSVVSNKLRIVTAPTNDIAQVGDVATFTVAVDGGTGPYTYRWEYMSDHFEWDAITGSWATGAQSDTLSFGVADDEFIYNYFYRCIITDAEGNQVVTDPVRVVQG